ncbi:MAG: hypothetical protein AB1578_23055 [Thermodesulfobacteriota bacterium]|jgi:hypothetical protein
MSRPPERLIEFGWLVLNRLDPDEERALEDARRRVLDRLQADFAEFRWEVPLVRRSDPAQRREHPSVLLEEGEAEREARHWDFALVVTRGDLRAYYKRYALATPSRALGVGVLSTARLGGGAEGVGEQPVGRRIAALALHLLGDLNGLAHDTTQGSYLCPPQDPSDLDGMNVFPTWQRDALGKELAEVADLRLEERAGRPASWAFYLRASWIALDDIASAVVQARPWEFPFHLSRLTTAAVSALLVVLLTAEAWDLGTSRPGNVVIALSVLSLVGTTTYILLRQRLLLRRKGPRLTEQRVAANVSITVATALGMATTYLGLFLLALGVEWALFAPDLVAGWTPSLAGPIRARHYLAMAGFAAALGLGIGALGASFEGQHYFRHVAYVDEET